MEYPVVYMVAGLSSRFKGKLPHKGFAKVGPTGETFIELSVDRAIAVGFNKIIFVVGRETEEAFREFFGEEYKGIPVLYALQEYDSTNRDRPWGTLDAVCSARNLVDGPFLVCTGDDLYPSGIYEKMIKHMKNESSCATVGYNLIDYVPKEGEVNRGVFEVREEYVVSSQEIKGISRLNLEEKGLSPSTPCSASVFLLQKNVLEKLYSVLEKFKLDHKRDRKIECYLNVELGKLIGIGEAKMKYYQEAGEVIGLTNPEDEKVVREKLNKLT